MGVFPTSERRHLLCQESLADGLRWIFVISLFLWTPILGADTPIKPQAWKQCTDDLIRMGGGNPRTARALRRYPIAPKVGFIQGLPRHNPELFGLSMEKKVILLPHLTEAAREDLKILHESLLPLLKDMNKKLTNSEDSFEAELAVLKAYWSVYQPGSQVSQLSSVRESLLSFLKDRKVKRDSPLWLEFSELARLRLIEVREEPVSPSSFAWELDFLELLFALYEKGFVSSPRLVKKLSPIIIERAAEEIDIHLYEALSKAFWSLQQGFDEDAKAELRGYLAGILNQVDLKENLEAFRSHLLAYSFPYNLLYADKIQLEFFLKETGVEHPEQSKEIHSLVREIDTVLSLHVQFYRLRLVDHPKDKETPEDQVSASEEEVHFASFLFVPEQNFFDRILREPLRRIISRFPDDEDLWHVLHYALKEIPRFQADLRKLGRHQEAENLEFPMAFLRTWEEGDARRKMEQLRSQLRASLAYRTAPDSDLESFDRATRDNDLLLSSDQALAFAKALTDYQRIRSHAAHGENSAPENDFQRELGLNYEGQNSFKSPVPIYFGYPKLISLVNVQGLLARAENNTESQEIPESDRRFMTYIRTYLSVRWGVLGEPINKEHWREIDEIYQERLRDQTR